MICMPWGDLLEAWGDSWMTVCHAEGGDLMLGGYERSRSYFPQVLSKDIFLGTDRRQCLEHTFWWYSWIIPSSFVVTSFLRHRQTAVPRS